MATTPGFRNPEMDHPIPEMAHKPKSLLNPIEKAYFNYFPEPEKIEPRKLKDFNPEEVEKDMEIVEKLKAKFESQETIELVELKQLSDGFEDALATVIETQDWMGPNVKVLSASEYDDYINGVDMIASFKDGDTIMAFAIDISFGGSQSLGKKLNRIKNEILQGNLAEVKYLKSKKSLNEPSQKAPRLILAADRNETVDDLLKARNEMKVLDQSREKELEPWSEGSDQHKVVVEKFNKRKREINKHLVEHPYQFDLLQQLKVQLECFVKFAQKNSKHALVPEYEKALVVIDRIIDSKLNMQMSLEQNPEYLARNQKGLTVVKNGLANAFH